MRARSESGWKCSITDSETCRHCYAPTLLVSYLRIGINRLATTMGVANLCCAHPRKNAIRGRKGIPDDGRMP